LNSVWLLPFDLPVHWLHLHCYSQLGAAGSARLAEIFARLPAQYGL
jgi:hypothetical protein